MQVCRATTSTTGVIPNAKLQDRGHGFVRDELGAKLSYIPVQFLFDHAPAKTGVDLVVTLC